MIYLTFEEVLEVHDWLIMKFGGVSGIRDKSLLLSALEMPKSSVFGQLLHPTLFDQAAAYLFHIVRNHPFIDGNKRTSAACALIFLDMNKIELVFDKLAFEELVVEAAEGKVTKKQISTFFKAR